MLKTVIQVFALTLLLVACNKKADTSTETVIETAVDTLAQFKKEVVEHDSVAFELEKDKAGIDSAHEALEKTLNEIK